MRPNAGNYETYGAEGCGFRRVQMRWYSGLSWPCGAHNFGVKDIAGVVNLFTQSSGLDLVISFAGILIFTGLTMYDAQKVKQMAAAEGTMDAAAIHKVGILGALTLYLDFINLFLHILRFLGRKR